MVNAERSGVHEGATTGAEAASGAAPGKALTPEAQRALAEAAERRRIEAEPLPLEHDGPSGAEPTRYGDWERKGIAVDF